MQTRWNETAQRRMRISDPRGKEVKEPAVTDHPPSWVLTASVISLLLLLVVLVEVVSLDHGDL